MNIKVGQKYTSVSGKIREISSILSGMVYYIVYDGNRQEKHHVSIEQWEYYIENNSVQLINEDAQQTKQTTPDQHLCNCPSRQLFNFGCKCGGI